MSIKLQILVSLSTHRFTSRARNLSCFMPRSQRGEGVMIILVNVVEWQELQIAEVGKEVQNCADKNAEIYKVLSPFCDVAAIICKDYENTL